MFEMFDSKVSAAIKSDITTCESVKDNNGDSGFINGICFVNMLQMSWRGQKTAGNLKYN